MKLATVLIVTLLTWMACAATAANPRQSNSSRASGEAELAAGGNGAAAPRGGTMQLTSNAFSAGGEFPKRNTCDGEDRSPELSWSDVPQGTKSLALIVDDPDAPGGTFTHWIAWDIPASAKQLGEGQPKTESLAGGGRQGRNDFGKTGYGGPCPPPGKPHRYFFRLYALDGVLDLKAGARRSELERAMRGHVRAQGELMGRYGR